LLSQCAAGAPEVPILVTLRFDASGFRHHKVNGGGQGSREVFSSRELDLPTIETSRVLTNAAQWS